MKTTQLNSSKNWLYLTLSYFIVIQLIGLVLRFMFFNPIPGTNYKFVLHGHSHVAFLGWVFSSIFIAFKESFLSESQKNKKIYIYLFWFMQVSIIGMLFSFPVQGYAAISITFSTLHIILTYLNAFFFLKDITHLNSTSKKWLQLAFFFMVLSTLGPWSLGPLMALKHSHTPIYYLAIYFYLHFQYNGWFSFSIFALLFQWFEKNNIAFSKRGEQLFFYLMSISCLSSYFLSMLWTHPQPIVYVIGFFSATLQVLALLILLNMTIAPIKYLHRDKKREAYLLGFTITCFSVKIILQFFSAWPAIADFAYIYKNTIIAYLHLVFLGFISLFLIFYFIQIRLLILNNLSFKGLILFICGFIGSEGLLVGQSLIQWLQIGSIPYYYQVLFSVSGLMPLGIFMLLVAQFRQKKTPLY